MNIARGIGFAVAGMMFCAGLLLAEVESIPSLFISIGLMGLLVTAND